tara:strand:- start:1429 stop:2274 length:846 start_codon:yes stop_codon:yes gene_type:complete
VNTSLIAGGIALLLALGLVVGLGVLSLLSGAFHFLFARPKLQILKTLHGANGFAFAFTWNAAREPAKFDTIRFRLFNPFGKVTQVDISKEFTPADDNFALDLELGKAYGEFLKADGFDKATVMIELVSSKDNVTHQFEMKGSDFSRKMLDAKLSAGEFERGAAKAASKPLYQTVERSFIAEPLPATNKVLKVATNPQFAEFFGGSGGGAAKDEAPKENFSIAKVWIEPGCIVCNACEDIYPEVFEVTADTCLIRPGAPLDDGLKVQEAAEACPVEVIKFTA